MSHEPFYKPHRKPDLPRQAVAGEVLFEFLRGHDRFRCELRDHGDHGVEAQFYQNEEFLRSRRFDPQLDLMRNPREMAVAWANEERKAIERTVNAAVICATASRMRTKRIRAGRANECHERR